MKLSFGRFCNVFYGNFSSTRSPFQKNPHSPRYNIKKNRKNLKESDRTNRILETQTESQQWIQDYQQYLHNPRYNTSEYNSRIHSQIHSYLMTWFCTQKCVQHDEYIQSVFQQNHGWFPIQNLMHFERIKQSRIRLKQLYFTIRSEHKYFDIHWSMTQNAFLFQPLIITRLNLPKPPSTPK